MQLSKALQHLAAQVRAGRRDWAALESEAMTQLAARGWQPDYLTVRRQHDLQTPQGDEPMVVLGAARLGKTRLIDNLEI